MNSRRVLLFGLPIVVCSILGGAVSALAVFLPSVAFAVYGLSDPDWDLDGGGTAIVFLILFLALLAALMVLIGAVVTIAGAIVGAMIGLLLALLGARLNLAKCVTKLKGCTRAKEST